ncbi:MAG: hypothetical protein WEE66_06245 [Actinomycetota bacterium]
MIADGFKCRLQFMPEFRASLETGDDLASADIHDFDGLADAGVVLRRVCEDEIPLAQTFGATNPRTRE